MLSLCPRSEIWKRKFSPLLDRIQTNVAAQILTFNLNHQKKTFQKQTWDQLTWNRACSNEWTGNFAQSLVRKSILLFGASHQEVCSVIEQSLFCNLTITFLIPVFILPLLILAISLISTNCFLKGNLSFLNGFCTVPLMFLILKIFAVSLY